MPPRLDCASLPPLSNDRQLCFTAAVLPKKRKLKNTWKDFRVVFVWIFDGALFPTRKIKTRQSVGNTLGNKKRELSFTA
jgi:hypothetical protein